MVFLAEYQAARQQAAIVPGCTRGFIAVTGGDRTAFLQGLLTNDIAALKPGQGCYAAYLTPQGRMITDLWVYNLGDELLVAISRDSSAAMVTRLDGLIFNEDVHLTDRSDSLGCVTILGPLATSVVRSLLDEVSEEAMATLPLHGIVRGAYAGEPVMVLKIDHLGLPGLELLGSRAAADALTHTLRERGSVFLTDEALETLRIEGGVPKFHHDMTEDTIPLEAGLESTAISFTKGCYVGQEVIVRVMHRGHGRVARRLVGIVFDGSDPVQPHARIEADGRQVGSVTSSTYSPSLKHAIALGYVQRELAEAGTRIEAEGVSGIVTPLPFRGMGG